MKYNIEQISPTEYPINNPRDDPSMPICIKSKNTKFNMIFIRFATTINADDKFGWPSTRIYWLSTAKVTEIGILIKK